jgi:hypothetical protein
MYPGLLQPFMIDLALVFLWDNAIFVKPTLFVLNSSDILPWYNHQADISARQCYLGGWIARVLDCFFNDCFRWMAVFLSQSENDVPIL